MGQAAAAFLVLMIFLVAFLVATNPGRAILNRWRATLSFLHRGGAKTRPAPPPTPDQQAVPLREAILLSAIGSALATAVLMLALGLFPASSDQADSPPTSAGPEAAGSSLGPSPEASTSSPSPAPTQAPEQPILITLGDETFYDLKAVTPDAANYVDVIGGSEIDGITEVSINNDNEILGCREVVDLDKRTYKREFVAGTLDPVTYQVDDLGSLPVPRRYPCYEPSWSPDDSTVAFWCASGSDLNDSVCTFERQTPTKVVLLQNDIAETGQVSWLPDGSGMLVATIKDTRAGGIFLLDRAGKVLRRVFTGGFDPAVSPDGKTFVVATTNGLFLYSIDPRPDERTRRLTVFREMSPAWSADGNQIAFIRGGFDPKFGSVFVVDVQTGRRVESYRKIQGYGTPNDLDW